jgi:predicted kinase
VAGRTRQPRRESVHAAGEAPTQRMRPVALIVAGPPATGKSSLGAALAQRLNAAFIDQDVATGALTDVIAALLGVHDLDDPRLATLTRGPRYETVIGLAEANLRLGVAVVLVAPFTRERRHLPAWNDLEGRLTAAGGRPTLVWLNLDPDQIRQRLRARSADRDADKLRDDADWATRFDLGSPVAPHLALEAAGQLGDLVNAVLEHLQR